MNYKWVSLSFYFEIIQKMDRKYSKTLILKKNKIKLISFPVDRGKAQPSCLTVVLKRQNHVDYKITQAVTEGLETTGAFFLPQRPR